MITHSLFVICYFFIDTILSLLLSTSIGHPFLFVPNLGFCAMILTIRKFKSLDAYIFAFSMGMLYDYLFAHTFLTYAFIYLFIAFVVQLWKKHMTDTAIELWILCISTLFVKESMIYFFMIFRQLTQVSIIGWFVRREFITLLINGLLVFIVIFLIRWKEEYLARKDRKIRKEEKIEWLKLK